MYIYVAALYALERDDEAVETYRDAVAAALEDPAHQAAVLAANALDVSAAREAGLAPALIERLTLTPARLDDYLAHGWRPMGQRIYTAHFALLGDGRLTDSKGVTVDFANTLVVMTSNLCQGPEYESRPGDDRAEARLLEPDPFAEGVIGHRHQFAPRATSRMRAMRCISSRAFSNSSS